MICQAPLDQAEQQETSSFVHTGFETVCGMTLRSASCLASRVCYVDSTREHVTRRVVRCPEDVRHAREGKFSYLAPKKWCSW